jgi:hypothetical protein
LWDIERRAGEMLKEMEMATGDHLYQERATGNSMDTILHKVKDQACHKSDIMPPEHHTFSVP